jgi:hypothetical protein
MRNSSQQALDYLLDGCERTWDKKSDCSWVTAACVTVFPGDSAVECHCAACRETFARGGGTSLIMGLFVKRMCEAVKQRWLDTGRVDDYVPHAVCVDENAVEPRSGR